ncbi:MAG: SPOR domain-containing protein [Flavobacteriales bacterium]|nr:SPOR domain-containing protein [Flavobacteriales bacterium]
MRFLYFIVCALFLTPTSAQELNRLELEENNVESEISNDSIDVLVNDSTTTLIGLVEKKDERIDLLIEDYTKNKKISGYRIQIFASSNNRWEAVKARSGFLKKYPEEKSYLIYQAPNYKVRIGDYTSRLMAHKHLELIKIDFSSAFIVTDEIDPQIK